VERLAPHRFLEAVDAGLDQPVDLLRAAVVEGLHQPELGEDLGEVSPGVPDRLFLHVGLVDHAVIPLRERRSGIEAAHRAEAVVRMSIPAEPVDVAEAARLAPAERAGPQASKSRVRSSLSAGRALIRSEARTMKRL